MRSRNNSKRQLTMFFAMYAWGVAGVATILAIVIDRLELPEDVKPGIGSENCFLKGERKRERRNLRNKGQIE